MKHLIYALIDPRDDRVHYVGKSSNGLQRPKRPHTAKCGAWQLELKTLGLSPEILILEEIADPNAPGVKCWWRPGKNTNALNDAERHWVAFWRAYGGMLLNETDGGVGKTGYKATPEWRAKLKARMLKPEVRAANSARMKKVWGSPELRAAQSARVKARMATPEARAANSASAKTRMSTPEARAANSARMKKIWGSPERRAAQSAHMKAWMATPEAQVLFKGDANPSRRPEVRAAKSARGKARMTSESRARLSEIAKTFWSSPEARALQSARAKTRMSTPEARAANGVRVKARMSTPEARANHPAKRPEVKAKIKARANARWAAYSPERRAEIGAAIRAGHAVAKADRSVQSVSVMKKNEVD
jgi:hypothetical protein